MKRSRIVGVVVLVLALVGVWWWRRGGDDKAAEGKRAADHTATTLSARADRAPALAAGESETSGDSPDDLSPEIDDDEEAPPKGHATVIVSVVTTQRAPVAGATVELRGRAGVYHAVTAADGGAKLADIASGPYAAVAWANGTPRVAKAIRVSREERVQLVLVAGAPVAGTVVDENKQPIADARVLAVGAGIAADPKRDAAKTDEHGNFRFAALAAGSVRLVAMHAEHANGTTSLIVLDGKTPKTDLVVTMPTGVDIGGRVVDTNKQPVVGAHVVVSALPPRTRGGFGGGGFGGGPGGGGFGGGGPGNRGNGRDEVREADTNAQGEFTVHGLPRGEVLASALAEPAQSAPKRVDASGGSKTDVELVLDRTLAIAGVVIDDTGAPIANAHVRAFPDRNQRGGGDGPDPGGGGGGGGRERGGRNGGGPPDDMPGDHQARTDAAGKFQLAGLAAGSWQLRATRDGDDGFGFGGPGGGRRGRGGAETDAVTAAAGATNVKITLASEGSVRGKLAIANVGPPSLFTVIVGPVQQAFLGTSAFELDAMPAGAYTLTIRGPEFQTYEQDVVINPGQAVDVGSIQLVQGRTLVGMVTSGGSPLANATVYAGTQVLGGGATNEPPSAGALAQLSGAAGTKTTTSAADGTFSLAGFGDGDLTLIADMPGVGRSPAQRVVDGTPSTTQLVLAVQPYGALSGTLTQGGQPAAGIAVSAQSTTVPGALYVTAAGPDGAFRFDQLAPDTYKVSATLRVARRGLQLFSQQATVPAGGEASVAITCDGGAVELDVTPEPSNGVLGAALVWLASTSITAANDSALSLALAGAGPGTSQMAIARGPAPAEFTEVAPGAYTVCVVPVPSELRGPQVGQYISAHAAQIPVYCVASQVGATPPQQALDVPVQIPPMIGGSGAGSN